MRKKLFFILALCVTFSWVLASAGGAAPKFKFSTTVAVGFQGREATVQVRLTNPNSVGGTVEARLQDEDGNVLGTA